MQSTFTAEELRVIQLGLEHVHDQLNGTRTCDVAQALIGRVKAAQRQIELHGAVTAAF
jgi:hypothetical protein